MKHLAPTQSAVSRNGQLFQRSHCRVVRLKVRWHAPIRFGLRVVGVPFKSSSIGGALGFSFQQTFMRK